ncbi:MAG: adenylate kinase [Candidatus Kerfeldbacteria bacterium]
MSNVRRHRTPLRIAILGPQGSGKGTQAELLSRRFRIPHISTGDIFRDHMKRRTPIGHKVKKLVDAGTLVPETLVLRVVRERLNKPDCKNGFIFDGFPRTIPQARFLSALFDDEYLVIVLELSDREAIQRLSGRRLGPDGTIYHVKYRPAPKSIRKFLVIRDDEKPAAVKHRLRQYRALTVPLVQWYEKRGMLVRIDAQPSIATIAKKISRVVSRRLAAST